MQEAKQVSIEISKLNWELIDLTFRFEWDDPKWLSDEKAAKPDEAAKRKKAVQDWSQKRERYLSSIKRRVKYEGLMGRVVAKDHLGRVPFRVVYDTEPIAGLDVPGVAPGPWKLLPRTATTKPVSKFKPMCPLNTQLVKLELLSLAV